MELLGKVLIKIILLRELKEEGASRLTNNAGHGTRSMCVYSQCSKETYVGLGKNVCLFDCRFQLMPSDDLHYMLSEGGERIDS